jgi:hypothetical protein
MTMNSDRFAIIPIPTDSSGREVTPGNAIFIGSRNAVMERVFDSKTRREALLLVNDAAQARGTLQALREEKQAIAARADAIAQAEDLVRELVSKVDTLTARMDEYEEEQRAKAEAEERANDPENQIVLPPGEFADEGELQANKEPHQRFPEHDGPEHEPLSVVLEDEDGDPGAVLPQTPIPPSDKHYDPHPSPVSTLNLASWKE